MTHDMSTVLSSLVQVETMIIDDRGSEMGLVTMSRPETLNPLDWEMIHALKEAFDGLVREPRVRVVAVTGSGRAFSAGGDMKKYQTLERDKDQFPQFMEDLHEMFTRISQYPKPFVALVNGIAVAGGFELILHCDVAIAGRSARIGDAHLPYGQMGGGGVLTLLPRAVGPVRARELIFSGRLLSPEEALDWGIVSQIVDDDQMINTGKEFAALVAQKSALAVRNAKQVLNAAFWEGTGVYSGLRLEREVTNRYCLTSDDAHEGLRAFAEKRLPNYQGT
jgi:enoyl-CoA hydratase